MTFIDKVPKELKELYIDLYIESFNLSRIPFAEFNDPRDIEMEDSSYKKVKTIYYDRDLMQESKEGKYLRDLENQNIFVKFYYYNTHDKQNRYFHDVALFFTFGDNSFKVFQANLNSEGSFIDILKQTKKYYEDNYKKIQGLNPLTVDKDYIVNFIAPSIPKELKGSYAEHIRNIFKIRRATQRADLESERKNVTKALEKELGRNS